MKFRYKLVLMIGCFLLVTSNVAGSAQLLPNTEADNLKFRVAIGDSATYEYTKVNYTNATSSTVEDIMLIDENDVPFNFSITQGLRFTIIISNITESTSIPVGRIQALTQIEIDGKITKESSSFSLITPTTDNITYWNEILQNNTDLGFLYYIDAPELTYITTFPTLLSKTTYNIHSGWVIFSSQQTMDRDGNIIRDIEYTMITTSLADVVIPFVNISIPVYVIGVILIVPVALAGGVLLAKLMK